MKRQVSVRHGRDDSRHRAWEKRIGVHRGAARARRHVYATDEKPPRAARGTPIAAAESFGARFVEAPDVGGIVDGLNCAVLSPGVPPTSPIVRRMHNAERSRARRDRARLSTVQGADRRRHRNEGQVDDDCADRASAARLRAVGSRRRQHRQSAHQGSARSGRRRRGSSPRFRRSNSRRFARSSLASPCCSTCRPTISTATIRWTSTPRPSIGSAPTSR